MPQANVYIGINGGHSKSVALAFSEDFAVAVAAKGPSLNTHTFPREVFVTNFDNLMKQLATRLNVARDRLASVTRRLVLSMPGAATRKDQDVVNFYVSQSGYDWSTRCAVADDTWAGLVAGTFSCIGTCAFAGTGASVFVNDDQEVNRLKDFPLGKPNKIDGWGPTIGDFGSGFQLVTDMFRFFNREFDESGTPALLPEILKRVEAIKAMEDVQRWFDSLYIVNPREWRIMFAQLAAGLVSAADLKSPDPDAKRLILNAANDMAESIRLGLERFPQAKNMPIVFQGGMFEYSRLYLTIVTEAAKKMTSGDVYLAYFRPVVGAAILALEDTNGLPTHSVIDQLANRIDALPEEQRMLLVRPHGRKPFN